MRLGGISMEMNTLSIKTEDGKTSIYLDDLKVNSIENFKIESSSNGLLELSIKMIVKLRELTLD